MESVLHPLFLWREKRFNARDRQKASPGPLRQGHARHPRAARVEPAAGRRVRVGRASAPIPRPRLGRPRHEISPRACEACRQQGLEVHQGTLLERPFPARRFDVILLHHVLEHLLEPVDVLRVAGGYLAVGGKVVVVTPHARAWSFSFFASCWHHLDAPRHLMLYDAKTLRLLGEKAGMSLARLKTLSSPKAWQESRQILRTQGRRLPAGLEPRRSLLESARTDRKPGALFRRLVSPLSLAAAAVGRGDILVAEFTEPGK